MGTEKRGVFFLGKLRVRETLKDFGVWFELGTSMDGFTTERRIMRGIVIRHLERSEL